MQNNRTRNAGYEEKGLTHSTRGFASPMMQLRIHVIAGGRVRLLLSEWLNGLRRNEIDSSYRKSKVE